MEKQRDASNRPIPELCGFGLAGIGPAQQPLCMPMGSRAHGIFHSAAQSSPTLRVTQPHVEIFEPMVPGLQIGYEVTHGLNDLSVSLPEERPT